MVSAVAGVAFLSILASGCGNTTPAPTTAEIKQQATQIMAQCIRSETDECKQMRDTLCDGLEAYIKEKGDNISLKDEFGSGWPEVSLAASSCTNLSTTFG